MSLLAIHTLGSPILREETQLVTAFDDDLRTLIADMFETMYAASGIGLAAPQVGRTERLTVVDVEGAKYAIVNPEIVFREGKDRAEEACLSMPELYGDVDRAKRVIVKALDGEGKPIEIHATGLLARCLQHEIDHLHGKLFIDYLSYLKRRAQLVKWEELRVEYPGNLRQLKAGAVTEPDGETM
ncbi:MAG: peptide deformylase [Cytophagaceae bacterium]|nr:peptide deformylase [Gemmatimonadaceae bacterium]